MIVYCTDGEGVEHELDVPEGSSLTEAMRRKGVGIMAACGGAGVCGLCHVYVDEEWSARLPSMDDLENSVLEGVPDRKSNSRLACQIDTDFDIDGLKIALAPGAV